MAPISLVSEPNLSVLLQEAAGNASLVITPSISAGGGDVAGFLGLSGSLTLCPQRPSARGGHVPIPGSQIPRRRAGNRCR